MAQPLILRPAAGMTSVESYQSMPHDDERPRPQEPPEKAPETPTDEPKPAPVQDPPAEPNKAPYVVRGQVTGRHH